MAIWAEGGSVLSVFAPDIIFARSWSKFVRGSAGATIAEKDIPREYHLVRPVRPTRSRSSSRPRSALKHGEVTFDEYRTIVAYAAFWRFRKK